MARFEFFAIAQEETGFWELPAGHPLASCRKFGVYLMARNERTHVCSLSPSSYAVFLSNEFDIMPDHERDDCPIAAAVEELETECGGQDHTYFGYVDYDRAKARGAVSDLRAYDVNVRHHKTAANSWRDAWELARQEAWREAEEDHRANWPYIPLPPAPLDRLAA